MNVVCMLGLIAALGFPGVDTTPDSEEQSPLSVYGDLRLRWESDWDSRRPNGTERADRDRFRIRARVGLRYEFGPALMLNARLRTGDHNSQQSPHITIWQHPGSTGEQDDVTLDRGFLRWKLPQASTLTIGRDGLAIWKPNEHFWDDDVYLDGFSYSTTHDVEDGAWHWTTLAALLPDGDASHDPDERSRIVAGQIRRTLKAPDHRIELAQSLFYIHDEDSTVNAVNDDENALYSYTSLQVTMNPDADVPLRVGGDVMYNFHRGPTADNPNEQFGFGAYVFLGRYKTPGDWILGYHFARIERWAVPRFMAQDDWFRWGSATQTRSSDYYGHELRAGYVLADNINLLARLYVADAITSVEDGTRFRLDLNIRF